MNTGLPCANLKSDRSAYIRSLLDRNVHSFQFLALQCVASSSCTFDKHDLRSSQPDGALMADPGLCNEFVPIEVRPLFGCFVDNDDLDR